MQQILTTLQLDIEKWGLDLSQSEQRENEQAILTWRREGLLYEVPESSDVCDDLYWIYATAILGDTARVVTHDQVRDHFQALRTFRQLQESIDRVVKVPGRHLSQLWQDQFIIQADFGDQDPARLSLTFPDPVTRGIQVSPNHRCLHLPPRASRTDDWTCVQFPRGPMNKIENNPLWTRGCPIMDLNE